MSTINDLSKEKLEIVAKEIFSYFGSNKNIETFVIEHTRREMEEFSKSKFNISYYYFKKIVNNFFSIKDKTKEQSEKLRIEHMKKTNLERYGVEYNWASKDPALNGKKTLMERYGVINNSQLETWKQAVRLTYKNKSEEEKLQIIKRQLASKHSARHLTHNYFLNGYYFDSAPEVAFYVYMTLHNNYTVLRESKILTYTYENKAHRYLPDFEINGHLYEIKADYWLKDREDINSQDYAKYQCMLANNVIVLFEQDYKFYLKWCEAHDWDIKSFKVENLNRRSKTAALADLLNDPEDVKNN